MDDGLQAERASVPAENRLQGQPVGVKDLKFIHLALRLKRAADANAFAETCADLPELLMRRDGTGQPHVANQEMALNAGILEAVVEGLGRHGGASTLALLAAFVVMNDLCARSFTVNRLGAFRGPRACASHGGLALRRDARRSVCAGTGGTGVQLHVCLRDGPGGGGAWRHAASDT